MVADDAKTNLTIPTFNGQHYTRWKKLVDLWRKATNVAEEKQGPVLILNMSGKAQDIALNLPNTNLETPCYHRTPLPFPSGNGSGVR